EQANDQHHSEIVFPLDKITESETQGKHQKIKDQATAAVFGNPSIGVAHNLAIFLDVGGRNKKMKHALRPCRDLLRGGYRMGGALLCLKHFHQHGLDDKTQKRQAKRQKQDKRTEFSCLRFTCQIPHDKHHEGN